MVPVPVAVESITTSMFLTSMKSPGWPSELIVILAAVASSNRMVSSVPALPSMVPPNPAVPLTKMMSFVVEPLTSAEEVLVKTAMAMLPD